MRKGPASFCGVGVRAAGLGGAISLLVAGTNCERQTFDLLDTGLLRAGGAAVDSAGAGLGSGVAGAYDSGGSSDSAGADSGAGARGSLGGSSAGVPSTGSGGVTSDEPCLPGEPCTDGGLVCPATVPFCNRCKTSKECDGDAPYCDAEDGRCAQCRVHGTDCAPDEICHPLTLRCVQACKNNDDCSSDHGRPLCDPFGACVSCSTTTDCRMLYGHSDDVCFFGTCVECYADQQCALDKPYCVGLRCQSKH